MNPIGKDRIKNPIHNHLIFFISNGTPFSDFPVSPTKVLFIKVLLVSAQDVFLIVAVHTAVAPVVAHWVAAAQRHRSLFSFERKEVLSAKVLALIAVHRE